MSLHTISVMVVVPLVAVVGAVLVLTPRDILRQPVMPVVEADARPDYTLPLAPRSTEIAVVEFETPVVQPASLIVVASAPEPPSGREASAASAPEPSIDQRWITARGLNVRTGPTVNASVISSLPFGTPVEVMETSGSWAHVRASDVTGWLSANFLAEDDPRAN